MFYTYILRSLKDNRYYYGSTSDIEKRLAEHNTGKVKSTRNRRPFVLHHLEEYSTRAEAYKREMFFKKRSGHAWLKKNSII